MALEILSRLAGTFNDYFRIGLKSQPGIRLYANASGALLVRDDINGATAQLIEVGYLKVVDAAGNEGAVVYPALVAFNEQQSDAGDFRVLGDTDTHLIFADYSLDAVSIGEAAIDGSAKFEVSSTSKGLLVPRMTGAQRDAIATPANGLHLYNTTTGKHNFREGGAWVEAGGAGSSDDSGLYLAL